MGAFVDGQFLWVPQQK